MRVYPEYSCEICGSQEYILCKKLTARLVDEKKAKFNVVRCKKCQLHSLYPIPLNTDLEWIYKSYSIKGDRQSVEKARIDKIYPEKIQKIKQYHSKPKVLDIGAGLGGFCFIAKCQHFETVGIEMEAEQVAIANKIFNVELINDSIENFIIYNDQVFDVIHMHHVLEHLRYPKYILYKLQNILSDDGIFFWKYQINFLYAEKS